MTAANYKVFIRIFEKCSSPLVACSNPHLLRTPTRGVPTMKTFPVGARILVDGRDEAVIQQVFPEGSSSFMFPHYRVRFLGGDSRAVTPCSA